MATGAGAEHAIADPPSLSFPVGLRVLQKLQVLAPSSKMMADSATPRLPQKFQ